MSKRFDTKNKRHYKKYNTDIQYYKNVPLKLIVYTENHFARLRAKRYNINNTIQNVWIVLMIHIIRTHCTRKGDIYE